VCGYGRSMRGKGEGRWVVGGEPINGGWRSRGVE